MSDRSEPESPSAPASAPLEPTTSPGPAPDADQDAIRQRLDPSSTPADSSPNHPEPDWGFAALDDLPQLGIAALWTELVALLSGQPGRTLLSGMVAAGHGIARLGAEPHLAESLRQEYATRVLGWLAAKLIDQGLDGRLGALPGRDITGREDAIDLLDRACQVSRIDQNLIVVDERIKQLLQGIATSPAAVQTLGRLQAEVCRAALPPPGRVPAWDELGGAKRAILTVLNAAAEALQNPEIAPKAGYKPGSLRHHYGELKQWGLIELTKDGYKITPAGKAMIPPGSV